MFGHYNSLFLKMKKKRIIISFLLIVTGLLVLGENLYGLIHVHGIDEKITYYLIMQVKYITLCLTYLIFYGVYYLKDYSTDIDKQKRYEKWYKIILIITVLSYTLIPIQHYFLRPFFIQ